MKQLRKDGARRRRFLKAVPAAVAGGLALPALAQPPAQEQRISKDILECGEKLFGVDFTDAEEEQALAGVNRNLNAYEQLRAIDVRSTRSRRSRSARTFRARHQSPGRRPARRSNDSRASDGSCCFEILARRSRNPASHGACATRSA